MWERGKQKHAKGQAQNCYTVTYAHIVLAKTKWNNLSPTSVGWRNFLPLSRTAEPHFNSMHNSISMHGKNMEELGTVMLFTLVIHLGLYSLLPVGSRRDVFLLMVTENRNDLSQQMRSVPNYTNRALSLHAP